jgi:hypothetical protein
MLSTIHLELEKINVLINLHIKDDNAQQNNVLDAYMIDKLFA